MPSPLVLVPTADGAIEAARLIDAAGIPIASVLEPGAGVEPGIFRDAVVLTALEHEGGAVAGVLFAARWGGGGVMLT